MGSVVAVFMLSLLLANANSTNARQGGSSASKDKRSNGGDSDSSSGDNCDQVSASISKQNDFTYNAITNVLQRKGKNTKADASRQCQSCLSNGGVGDVTRLVATVFGNTTSVVLCSGCPFGEVPATDIKFCPGDASSKNSNCKKPFGPCTGVTIYVCNCAAPATTPAPTVAQTQPVASTQEPYIG